MKSSLLAIVTSSLFATVSAAPPPLGGPGGPGGSGGPDGPSSLVNVVMFVHVAVAIGLFVAISIEAMAVMRMRGAGTIMQVRECMLRTTSTWSPRHSSSSRAWS